MLETLAIGVIGGFLSGVSVYVVRQKRRADRLRQAIVTEIRRSTPVGTFKAALLGPSSLKTPIIDSNLDKLYLLNKDEIRHVATYHQHMEKIRNYNENNSGDDVISIPSELQDTGGEIATNTAQTLEENIISFPRPIRWIGSRFTGEDETEPTIINKKSKERERS